MQHTSIHRLAERICPRSRVARDTDWAFSWHDRDAPQGRREGPAVKVEELPLLLTVDEAAEVLRIGRNGAYAAVANGSLPSVRIGRTIRIPRDALAVLLGADTRPGTEWQSGRGG